MFSITVSVVVGATFAPCGGKSPLCRLSTGGGGRTSVGGTRADIKNLSGFPVMIFLAKSRFIALYSDKCLFFMFVRMDAVLFEKRIGY
jgi:hypothetical protein